MTGLLYLALTWCAASMLLGKKVRNHGWKLWSCPAWAGSCDCSCSKPVRNVGIKKQTKHHCYLHVWWCVTWSRP